MELDKDTVLIILEKMVEIDKMFKLKDLNSLKAIYHQTVYLEIWNCGIKIFGKMIKNFYLYLVLMDNTTIPDVFLTRTIVNICIHVHLIAGVCVCVL